MKKSPSLFLRKTIISIFIVLVVAAMIGCKFLPKTIGNTIGTYIVDVCLLTVAMIGVFEMCNIMERINKPTNKLLAFIYPIFNFVVLLIALKFNKIYFVVLTEIVCLLIYFLVVLLTELITSKNTFKQKAKISFNTLLTCLYPAFMFCCFLIINHCDVYFDIKNISVVFILLIIAITFLTDTFAYIVGSLLHGPKLAPKISPNKTISGAVGGLIGGVAGAMLVYALVYNVTSFSALLTNFNVSWWGFLIIGIIGAIVGQAGDLFESFLKRKAQIKDTSNILGSHGGMLDRVDAMTFNVVFMLIVVIILL